MNGKIEDLLANRGGNYILPFFWQHGEDEATLREYMDAIQAANIGAVCVESRPHPDFCGPKWWADMDVILDEARKRGMKVWILDDSHFPTGFANGAMLDAPAELCRQSIRCSAIDCAGRKTVELGPADLSHPRPLELTEIERMIQQHSKVPTRVFDDDRLLSVCAMRVDADGPPAVLDLTSHAEDGRLAWTVPLGHWRVHILHLSRNFGPHRTYINMMDRESCRLLIDAVYEPHFQRYARDFGTTIAGFFSDEPELGNGKLYDKGNVLGRDLDLPWSRELEERLRVTLGREYARQLPLLWENEADAATTACVRFAYMDAVTSLVQRDFSEQIGEWCERHGVEYIGHVIEDDNQHARTGSSLGHFFRGLAGHHMGGVDVVSRQILPQSEDLVIEELFGPPLDREFFHFVLAKLASSHAAIDPRKRGRAMCEIFGNYGWAEGVRLEKYLADHFLVRGINHYVPHAFSPKEFPDDDCPPHFYAHGNDPQYRHFGRLVSYMNRICELSSGGRRMAPVALLYHAEAEWTGRHMLMQKPARVLAEHQVDFDIVPHDVFGDRERYRTRLDERLVVNTQEYRALVVPAAQFVTRELAIAVADLRRKSFPVLFIDYLPEGICNARGPETPALLESLDRCAVVRLDELVHRLQRDGCTDIALDPMSRWIRGLRYRHDDGSEIHLFVNEGTETYRGTILVAGSGESYAYDAWENRLNSVDARSIGDTTELQVEIQPLKSLIVVFDERLPGRLNESFPRRRARRLSLNEGWKRSICSATEFPAFSSSKEITLPDTLAEERPEFSGFVRYERELTLAGRQGVLMEIEDAHEGVELFVNGTSAGIQIVPPFEFDITELVVDGTNRLVIEVATTLERQVGRRGLIAQRRYPAPTSPSGISGTVSLYLA